jgi:hypothetical protein
LLKELNMAEPSSSAAAGGYAAYKLIIALGLPAGVAALIVMLWVQPKSPREWALALICTLAGSLYGGAYAVRHFGLQDWGATFEGELALGGIRLLCGLPAWVLVRAAFLWAEKRKGKDIAELLTDVKDSKDKL